MQNILEIPVITPSGHIFEKSSIEEWLRRSSTNPITQEVLQPNDLVLIKPIWESLLEEGNNDTCYTKFRGLIDAWANKGT